VAVHSIIGLTTKAGHYPDDTPITCWRYVRRREV